jgi:hypothetical protein
MPGPCVTPRRRSATTVPIGTTPDRPGSGACGGPGSTPRVNGAEPRGPGVAWRRRANADRELYLPADVGRPPPHEPRCHGEHPAIPEEERLGSLVPPAMRSGIAGGGGRRRLPRWAVLARPLRPRQMREEGGRSGGLGDLCRKLVTSGHEPLHVVAVTAACCRPPATLSADLGRAADAADEGEGLLADRTLPVIEHEGLLLWVRRGSPLRLLGSGKPPASCKRLRELRYSRELGGGRDFPRAQYVCEQSAICSWSGRGGSRSSRGGGSALGMRGRR